ncbi:DUF4446 family protein [Isachenkonia alkalipeptolytica]|nr:DUF4446 family protein [Isachenkonia alkalipeptolytica]
MEAMINYLETNTIQVLMIMALLQALLVLLWIRNTVKMKKMIKNYEEFLRGTDKTNLEAMLRDHVQKVEKTQEVLNTQKKELHRLEKGAANCIQKVHTKRYNAFDNTGNDLSYSTAFLDAYNSGLVLTGIYGRDYAASYVKAIEQGLAKQVLSREENEALEAAMKQDCWIRSPGKE